MSGSSPPSVLQQLQSAHSDGSARLRLLEQACGADGKGVQVQLWNHRLPGMRCWYDGGATHTRLAWFVVPPECVYEALQLVLQSRLTQVRDGDATRYGGAHVRYAHRGLVPLHSPV